MGTTGGCNQNSRSVTEQKKTWSEHTLTGWHLGNARFHYRCHEVWVKDTKRTRISQTVFFKTNFITKPEFTTTDALLRSTEDLVQLIRGDAHVKGGARKAIDMLLDIFKKKRTNSDTEIDVQRQQILKAATNLASSETKEMDAVRKSNFEREEIEPPSTSNWIEPEYPVPTTIPQNDNEKCAKLAYQDQKGSKHDRK